MTKRRVYQLSFWLTIYVFIVLVMIAEVIKSVLFGKWSGMIVPFFIFLLIVTEIVKVAAKLHRKKVFVVFKDKDW